PASTTRPAGHNPGFSGAFAGIITASAPLNLFFRLRRVITARSLNLLVSVSTTGPTRHAWPSPPGHPSLPRPDNSKKRGISLPQPPRIGALGAATPAARHSKVKTARSPATTQHAVVAHRGSADQAALVRGRYRRGPVADAELGVDVQQVGLDRGLADQQPPGGDLVGGAVGDQLEDFELAWAQVVLATAAGGADQADQLAGHRGSQHGLAPEGRPDRLDQLITRGVLEQVAGGAGFEGGHHVAVGVVGGED